MSSIYTFFVSITPGLEPLLADEVQAILQDPSGPPKLRTRQGGVEVSGPLSVMWRLAHESRLAEGIRIRLRRFRAAHFESLKIGLGKLPWAAYLPRGATPEVRVSTQKSALYHKGAIIERAEEVIWDRLRSETPNPDLIDVPKVYLRIVKNWVDVSIDAVGERLHRRGYREHIGKAPMRETLAAAMVQASGLDLTRGLWDPFCGSGTLPLEAALMVSGVAATGPRAFGFENWPIHQEEAYADYLRTLQFSPPANLDLDFYASDIDGREIRAARHNAKQAQLEDHIRMQVGDFEDMAQGLPSGIAILTNLPYGHRTHGGQGLDQTYRRFGRMLRERRDITEVVVLSGELNFPKATGLRWKALLRFKNRGLPVHLLKLDC